MKLYYAPGACSLAPHLLLIESEQPFTLERVDIGSRMTESGAAYLEINPHGYVPTLELDSGQRIMEVPVILQYIADQVPERGLVPREGTMERYQVLSWLNFITSEIHKGFGPLFADDTPIHYRPAIKDRLRRRFSHVASHLESHPYLMGEQFGIADAHLWVMTNWIRLVGIDPDTWPALMDFQKRIRERPSVRRAIKEENLDW